MLKIPKPVLLFLLALTHCTSHKGSTVYSSETLKIIQLSEHSYIHVSYLQTKSLGKVACNGYLLLDAGEALVFDTPSDKESTKELLGWLENTKSQKVTGLVVNHFHVDAIGGITEFHQRGIPSFAHEITRALIHSPERKPQNTFADTLLLTVGHKNVANHFLGEAHTVDNIVSYVPEEQLIFGGCMIKTLDAGKGNLNDANVSQWSTTVGKVKSAFPKAKTVIPGHGPHGGPELLDYTIALFKND